MDYLPVKDLKKTRELWRLLAEEKELVVTRDGRPCAVIVAVTPETVEESVREIRRALFGLGVRKAREAGRRRPVSRKQIADAVGESRTRRSRR